MRLDEHEISSLRQWVCRTVGPYCQAEPDTLAKYVVALVQNDLDRAGLRRRCEGELTDIMGESTTKFVNQLFNVLDNGAYIERRGDESRQEEASPHKQSEQRQRRRRRRRRGGDEEEEDEEEDEDEDEEAEEDDDEERGSRRAIQRRRQHYDADVGGDGRGGRGGDGAML